MLEERRIAFPNNTRRGSGDHRQPFSQSTSRRSIAAARHHTGQQQRLETYAQHSPHCRNVSSWDGSGCWMARRLSLPTPKPSLPIEACRETEIEANKRFPLDCRRPAFVLRRLFQSYMQAPSSHHHVEEKINRLPATRHPQSSDRPAYFEFFLAPL